MKQFIAFSLLLVTGLGLAALAPAGEAPSMDRACRLGEPYPGHDFNWVQPGLITAEARTFMVLINGSHAPCECAQGFLPQYADFHYYVPAGVTLPYTWTSTFTIREAVLNPAGGCPWIPGDVLLPDAQHTADGYAGPAIPGRGTLMENAACISNERPVFLCITVSTTADQPLGLYTNGDGTPLGCAYWMDDGTGPVNMVDAGLLTEGEMILNTNGDCCTDPVADSGISWSGLKARYQ